MAEWMTLLLRVQQNKNQSNRYQGEVTNLSRDVRSLDQQLSLQKSLLESQETRDLNNAKSEYDEVRLKRPLIKSVDGETKYYDENGDEVTKDEYDELYKAWSEEFSLVKDDYQTLKTEIENYYDDLKQEVESEATLKQSNLEEEQTSIETQLEAVNQEISKIKDQISTNIGNSTIKLA